MSRILCLALPDLLLRIALRAHPELEDAPIVIGGSPSEARPVLACSPAAQLAGVRAGMRLKEAQAYCPEAHFLPPMPVRLHETLAEFGTLLGEVSPAVEIAADGIFWIALDGSRLLWPDEQVLATRVGELVASYDRLSWQIGIADTKYAALVAALERGIRIVPPGADTSFLHDQPIDRLPAPAPMIATLRTMGITSLGAFAALPPNAVVTRFGKDARRLQLLARGFDDTRVIAWTKPSSLEARICFESGETVRERMLWIVERRLTRLYRRMEQSQLAPHAIRLRLQLENGMELQEVISVEDPLLRARELHERLRWHMQDIELPAAVEEVRVSFEGLTPVYGRQLDLFAKHGADDVRRLYGELLARWGATSVSQVQLVASRRLEVAWEWNTPTSVPSSPSEAPYASSVCLEPVLRLLSEPRPIVVKMTDDQPSMLIIGRRRERIVAVGGPWRLCEGWWDQPIDRDEYQVSTAGGTYAVVHDRIGDSWLLLGGLD